MGDLRESSGHDSYYIEIKEVRSVKKESQSLLGDRIFREIIKIR